MAALLLSLQLATEAALVLLTLAALVDWLRHRDSRHGYLALAFGSLTAVILTPGRSSTFTLQLPQNR